MRVAIIGGGISGLTAAYELEKGRRNGADIDWHLYEASDRLGGIIETTRKDGFILESGPDGWVTEKPLARELAIELGLEDQLIYSNDATRKTYIYLDGQLQAMPDGMRMMVPTDLAALEASPLFSTIAKTAYAAEPGRAEELKGFAPKHDESVAAFVRRHFGNEVLDRVGAPLLSGVFGGDVHKLSVQAVMMPFVKMEREQGSLILALQRAAQQRGDTPQQPIFTSLRHGVGSLVEALISRLPAERLHLRSYCYLMKYRGWIVNAGEPVHISRSTGNPSVDPFEQVLIATTLDSARRILPDQTAKALLPIEASSAVLAALAWSEEVSSTFTIPPGFGFLVPPTNNAEGNGPRLLAATFVDQKFPYRAPKGARVIRAFFGSGSAEHFAGKYDQAVVTAACQQLEQILGPLPPPSDTEVSRWPRSLPQYEVGHLERIAQLDEIVSAIPGLHLLGNAYRGVGLPDLIRNARTAARALTS